MLNHINIRLVIMPNFTFIGEWIFTFIGRQIWIPVFSYRILKVYINSSRPPIKCQRTVSMCLLYIHLPLKLLNINYVQECITFELSIKNNLCIIAALYRFPIPHSHSKFANFTISLELTLQAISSKNLFLSLVLGDFNAKNKIWSDQNNTTTEGTITNDLMTQYGLTQIIHEPSHLLDCSFSCIDLIFTS